MDLYQMRSPKTPCRNVAMQTEPPLVLLISPIESYPHLCWVMFAHGRYIDETRNMLNFAQILNMRPDNRPDDLLEGWRCSETVSGAPETRTVRLCWVMFTYACWNSPNGTQIIKVLRAKQNRTGSSHLETLRGNAKVHVTRSRLCSTRQPLDALETL